MYNIRSTKIKTNFTLKSKTYICKTGLDGFIHISNAYISFKALTYIVDFKFRAIVYLTGVCTNMTWKLNNCSAWLCHIKTGTRTLWTTGHSDHAVTRGVWRFAPLGFYWIPTYCLVSVRAMDQFNHWLNSSWQRFKYCTVHYTCCTAVSCRSQKNILISWHHFKMFWRLKK